MTQRTKLLLVIPHLGGGGAERVVAQLMRLLNPQRFEINLCLISNDGPGAEAPPAWVRIRRLNVRRVRHAWLQLIRLVRAERPDVILSGMAHLNFLLLMLKPFLPPRIRILVRQNTTASSTAKTWLSQLPYRALYPRADAIICQSGAMADDLHENFAIPREKLKVLANPIDTIAPRGGNSADNDAVGHAGSQKPNQSTEWPPNSWPRLLAVGRLAPEKGMDLLLRAIYRVREHYPQIHLQILGAGPEESFLRELSAELQLEQTVRFRGYVASPVDYFAEATLFVLPSRYEGMPNALLEAAAAGLPLVATPCSAGLCDLLHEAPGTWLSSAITAESLAESILHALAALSASLTAPHRYQHAFLTPFESRTAIAAYEALLENVAPAVKPKLRIARPPRIAMLIPTIDEIGGAERQVLLLAKELSMRGLEVTIVALSGSGSGPNSVPNSGPGSPAAAELAAAGVVYISLNMRKAWIDPRGWRRYLAWAAANKPDIVHAHLPHATWFARWVRLLAPVRVLVDTIHTSNTGSKARHLGYRLTNRLTSQVTCVSESVAGAVVAAHMASKEKLVILPNGIVLSQPRAALSPQSSFRWIAVGRLAPVKDYPTLLHAFAMLPCWPNGEPNCQPKLQIVGSGPEELSLRDLARQLKIEDRVEFAGFQHNPQPFLDSADAFVLSSLWEGLPIGVLEAAASSLPVVATDGNGTHEAMISGETGLLVPVGDIQALSKAMTDMMSMPPSQRLKMGTKGRNFVEESFSITVVADRWEKLYADLLKNHRDPSRLG